MIESEPFLKKVEEYLRKKLPKPERAILLGLFMMLFGGGVADFANALHIGGFTYANGVLIWLLGLVFAFLGGFEWIEGRRSDSEEVVA